MKPQGKPSLLQRTIFTLGKKRIEEINPRIKHINRRLANRDMTKARFALVEPYHPVSLKHFNANGIMFNPNQGGNCAGYVTRIAHSVFGKKYTRGSAWDLPNLNEVVFRKAKNSKEISKLKMLRLMRKGIIKPGTILGYTTQIAHKIEKAEKLLTQLSMQEKVIFGTTMVGQKQFR